MLASHLEPTIDAPQAPAGMTPVSSWSNVLPTRTRLAVLRTADELETIAGSLIARGAGRSFGDAAYVTDGTAMSSLRLTRVFPIEDDGQRATVLCESGVPVGALIRHLHARGYAFPVYGGTQWATVGGAVAADIHGKNVAAEGTFGHHVESIELYCADEGFVRCSSQERPQLFRATIGGMGLTGFILRVCLRLSARLRQATEVTATPVAGVAEAIEQLTAVPADYQFCTWVNGARAGAPGLCYHARYVDGAPPAVRRAALDVRLPRLRLFTPLTIGLVAGVHRAAHRRLRRRVHVFDLNYFGMHERFVHWNRLFGRRGMIEYHFAVPAPHFADVFARLAEGCRRRGIVVYFAVMKHLSAMAPAGLLSFAGPGLAMNFQVDNTDDNRRFLGAFTDVLLERGGRVYLAKDSCLQAPQFERMFDGVEEWRRIVRRVDAHNRVQSDLSRRLGMKPW